MIPVERLMRRPFSFHGSRWPGLRRMVIFILVQMIAITAFFWAGIFTLISAIWHANPGYIWVFLLIAGGLELLMLRIVFQSHLLAIMGVLFLGGGLWLHHHNATTYDQQICHFMKQSTCREFGNGFLCRDETSGMVIERMITPDEIAACAALDEL